MPMLKKGETPAWMRGPGARKRRQAAARKAAKTRQRQRADAELQREIVPGEAQESARLVGRALRGKKGTKLTKRGRHAQPEASTAEPINEAGARPAITPEDLVVAECYGRCATHLEYAASRRRIPLTVLAQRVGTLLRHEEGR